MEERADSIAGWEHNLFSSPYPGFQVDLRNAKRATRIFCRSIRIGSKIVSLAMRGLGQKTNTQGCIEIELG